MAPNGDEYVDGDLPGLDSDIPGLDEVDVSPDPGPTTDPAPLEEPASQWTHDELDDWFENDFGGDKAFYEKIGSPLGIVDLGFEGLDVPIEMRPSVEAYSQQSLGIRLRDGRTVDAAAHHWRNLSKEMKEQFRTGWSAWEKADEPPDELDPDPVVDELAPLPIIGERLPILENDPVGDEPANGESSSPAPGSFKWLMVVAAAALVGLAIGAAVLLMDNNSEGSEVAVNTVETSPATTASTTAEASPAKTASTTSEESTSTPPTSSGTLDPLVESPPLGDTYTATKTADLATDARGGHREVPPVGTSYEATLLVEETCTGDICSYQSTLDLESACCPTEPADYLLSIEWGQREPATWEVNESSWTIEMSAQYAYAESQDGLCVVLLEDFWELTITDTQVIDNDTTAAMFTGTITRSDSLDQSISTLGSHPNGQVICPFATQPAIDQWSVAGVAIINPAQTS
jgi:hypothetical protein